MGTEKPVVADTGSVVNRLESDIRVQRGDLQSAVVVVVVVAVVVVGRVLQRLWRSIRQGVGIFTLRKKSLGRSRKSHFDDLTGRLEWLLDRKQTEIKKEK